VGIIRRLGSRCNEGNYLSVKRIRDITLTAF